MMESNSAQPSHRHRRSVIREEGHLPPLIGPRQLAGELPPVPIPVSLLHGGDLFSTWMKLEDTKDANVG